MKAKKVVKIVLNVLLWLFIIFSVLMTVFAIAAQGDPNGIPSIGGKYFLCVQSDSMSPTFEKGDLIIGTELTEVEKRELKPKSDSYKGDVITFKSDLDGNGTKELNTHRIIGIKYSSDGKTVEGYYTQGDHNSMQDSDYVACVDIICIWKGGHFPVVGTMIDVLKENRTAFFLAVVLPLAALFVYEVIGVVRSVYTVKNAGKKQITAADEELIKQRAIEEYLRLQAEAKAVSEEIPDDKVSESPKDDETSESAE